MTNQNQLEESIVFDNLIRSIAGDKTSLEASGHNIEPFSTPNGAGDFLFFKDREEVASTAFTAGEKVKSILTNP